MIDFSSRAAMVTGASGNLGHTVVRAFLERGAHVAAPVRSEDKAVALRTAVDELAGTNDDPHLITEIADVADRAAMEAFVERVMRAWGRLDVLANLAGGFATGSAIDIDGIEELWKQNVRTTITATAACLRPMRARGYGRVVSVGAMSGLKGRKGAAGYAMAKGTLIRWTEALSDEVKGEGITVNVVMPSTIDNPTNRAAMPKADPKTWVRPAELASLILYLCSEGASAVTGAAIPVTART